MRPCEIWGFCSFAFTGLELIFIAREWRLYVGWMVDSQGVKERAGLRVIPVLE